MSRNFYVMRAAGLRRLVLFLCFYCSIAPVQAQVVKRVLFIGNSFIGTNDLPSLVRELASRAGVMLEYEAYTPGGATVKYIPHGMRSHANNPAVYDLIRSRPWDYLVVQDNQGFFCLPSLGDYGMYDETEEGHMQLRDSMLKANPCARMLLFSGWVDKDPYAWEPSLGLHTAAEANQKVYEQYQYLNDHFVHQLVSPIGIVWNRVMAALPGLELFAGDNYHPSYEGSYVTAATLFSAIYGRSPEEVLFDGSLAPSDAKTIRRIAYEVVRDSLKPTGLATQIPELTWRGGDLVAEPGYMMYEWYRDGVAMPGAAGVSVTPVPESCYQLKVRDSKGCELWSLSTCYTLTTAIPGDNTMPAFSMGPNPVTDILYLDHAGIRRLSLTDITGKVLYQAEAGIQKIDMRNYAPGIYLLRAEDGQGRTRTEKVIRQ